MSSLSSEDRVGFRAAAAAERAERGVVAPLRTERVRLTPLVAEVVVPVAVVDALLLAAILLGLLFNAVAVVVAFDDDVEEAGALRAVVGVDDVPLEGGFLGVGLVVDIAGLLVKSS